MNSLIQGSEEQVEKRILPSVKTGEFQVAGFKRPFSFFDTEISRLECAKVLGGGSYPIPVFLENIRTILDVGAHTGSATTYFALHRPDATVLAFEPDPESFRLLVDNTSDLPNVVTFNCGLDEKDRNAGLYLGNVDPATNSLSKSDFSSGGVVSVQLKDPRPILEARGIQIIDILKIDTEGHEVSILKAFQDWLPSTRVICFEFHSEGERRSLDELLAPTHGLCWGNITSRHRGELCYVLESEIPEAIDLLALGTPG